jgi:PKD repeat protein
MTPTSFAPKENVPTGVVGLAAIGSAANGTGSWSATVNWGDATATQDASVSITGATGMVTGPTHTYTTPGNYTVTTTLANTDGTTLTTTESVTVTGPTITKFSKTSVKQGKTLVTTISGTGFTARAVVTTSNSGITVVSAKVGKATKKHPNPTLKLKLKASKTAALGPFNVTLTESSGTTTATGAITVLVK